MSHAPLLDLQKVAGILELLSSRICHDLVSPVGAINNGLEFMEDAADDPESIKQASELIAHSANSAAARLQAFRLAYGAGGRDGNIKPEDIQRAFGNLIRAEGKVRQSWDPFSPLGIDSKAKGFCKCLMGALILAAEALPKGGTVYVDAGSKGQTLIRAEGTDATVRDGVVDALSLNVDPDTLDPRLVHPYSVSVIAQSYGFKIAVLSTDKDKVVYALTQNGAE
jgi:histidine phosphotransferase ChpT